MIKSHVSSAMRASIVMPWLLLMRAVCRLLLLLLRVVTLLLLRSGISLLLLLLLLGLLGLWRVIPLLLLGMVPLAMVRLPACWIIAFADIML